MPRPKEIESRNSRPSKMTRTMATLAASDEGYQGRQGWSNTVSAEQARKTTAAGLRLLFTQRAFNGSSRTHQTYGKMMKMPPRYLASYLLDHVESVDADFHAMAVPLIRKRRVLRKLRIVTGPYVLQHTQKSTLWKILPPSSCVGKTPRLLGDITRVRIGSLRGCATRHPTEIGATEGRPR